jgi:hypothetical protein
MHIVQTGSKKLRAFKAKRWRLVLHSRQIVFVIQATLAPTTRVGNVQKTRTVRGDPTQRSALMVSRIKKAHPAFRNVSATPVVSGRAIHATRVSSIPFALVETRHPKRVSMVTRKSLALEANPTAFVTRDSP